MAEEDTMSDVCECTACMFETEHEQWCGCDGGAFYCYADAAG